MKKIILASGSPRRQQFLKELDLPYEVILKPVDETYPAHLQREQITDYLAQLKATPFAGEIPANCVRRESLGQTQRHCRCLCNVAFALWQDPRGNYFRMLYHR